MNNLRTLLGCVFGPRSYSFYKFTRHTISTTTPEVLPRSRSYQPNPLESISDNNPAQKDFLEELCPPIKRSFNLAAYVNNSKTLQELIKLQVSLFDIENTNHKAANHLLTLDFEKDCVPYIRFLIYHGLKERNLGKFISEFPEIFQEHIDDLQTRINHLESMSFSKKMIAKILNRSSIILSRKTKFTDYKLGCLQIEFKLPSHMVRDVIVGHPQVIALPEKQYTLVNFSLTQEFGFRAQEVGQILKAQPFVLDIIRPILIERLDLVHNMIGLSHSIIVKYPKLITGPRFDIKHRSLYLKKLNRDQFNQTLPLYVPPSALYNISDEEFCFKYAKTHIEDYKLFIKNL